jgi:hypothetical protein
MSKLRFLKKLRHARNLFVHRVHVDSRTTDAETIARRLASSALWLTPFVVEDFDPAEFPEIPEADRERLSDAVDRFAGIARSVPPNQPATDNQILEATVAFQAILDLLQNYIQQDREADEVRRILMSLTFPREVLTWDIEFGTDSTGDPALWLWIILEDGAANDVEFAALTAGIRDQIRRALRDAHIESWPYVRFRTASEEQEILQGATYEPSW